MIKNGYLHLTLTLTKYESVVSRTVPIASQSTKVPSQPAEKKLPTGSKRSSQAALLAGAVKRKR